MKAVIRAGTPRAIAGIKDTRIETDIVLGDENGNFVSDENGGLILAGRKYDTSGIKAVVLKRGD